MSARIRYTNTDKEGILESNNIFVSQQTGARYKVFINIIDKTFRIRNELSKLNIVMGGEGINNLNVLKRAAKRSLEKLGVNFKDEMRRRSFGLCDKGYNQSKHLNKQLPSHNETE